MTANLKWWLTLEGILTTLPRDYFLLLFFSKLLYSPLPLLSWWLHFRCHWDLKKQPKEDHTFPPLYLLITYMCAQTGCLPLPVTFVEISKLLYKSLLYLYPRPLLIMTIQEYCHSNFSVFFAFLPAYGEFKKILKYYIQQFSLFSA